MLRCEEPAGALDARTGIVALEALQRVDQEPGTSTAVTHHSAGIARMAYRVIHLADGLINKVHTAEKQFAPRELSW